jgi:putative SOS response-associated peptidase YedK
MCGRYAFHSSAAVVAEEFGLLPEVNLPPRYNVAPTQLVAVVAPAADCATRKLGRVRWGLVPYWAERGRPFPGQRTGRNGGVEVRGAVPGEAVPGPGVWLLRVGAT